ncbi:MAG TPA: hypothetical protein VHJ18_00485 [Streptosporangiaceae bacterium]|jgi:hypothetical protein|nr:hypothetical protein [Streptosporangiaceae bacterium]
MPAHEVVDDDLIDGVHGLIGNPVTADFVGPERVSWQPVGEQAAFPHAF